MHFLSGKLSLQIEDLPFILDPFPVVDAYIKISPYAEWFSVAIPVILGVNLLCYSIYKNNKKIKKARFIIIIIICTSFATIIYLGKILYDQLSASPASLTYYNLQLGGQNFHLWVLDMFFLAYSEVLIILFILWYVLIKVEQKINNYLIAD